MKFDDVLLAVGEFGLYQKRLLLLISVTGGCVVIQNLSPVFTMKIPKHRCKIPGYANDTYDIHDVHHAWHVNQTIPITEDGDYSPCTMYDVTVYDDGISHANGSQRHCDEWVYDKSVFTETLTSQLNLVCDKKIYRSHSSMMIFAGKFVGAFLTSVTGDYFGRRRVYLVMMLSMMGTAVALVFVPSLPALMALRFLAGGTATGSYLCTYVIGMELMGKSQRRFTTVAFKSCEIVMTLMATLFAFLLRHWSHFQASLAAPCALLLVGYFFIPESPRWLMSKGRMVEAQKVMDSIAHVNGVPPPPRLQQALDNSETPSSDRAAVSPLALFRVPRLMFRYMMLYFCWIFISMCMYGLMLNVSNMNGDIFLNFSLMSAVDVLSLLLYLLLIERVGRRPLLVAVSALGGLACLTTILPTVLGGSDWILRGLSITGRMFVAAAFMCIYVMSPELFPTVLRSFGLGSCSMLSRIGGLASPYVADLNTYVGGLWSPALPQVVFGIAGVTTSGLISMMPETRGRCLPETIGDAVVFGKQDLEPREPESDGQKPKTAKNLVVTEDIPMK